MTPLRHVRTRLALTQAELAAAVGVTEATVCRWETGVRRPPHAQLRRTFQRLFAERGWAWEDRLLFEAVPDHEAPPPPSDPQEQAA